jgi:hypothetical protein
VEETHDIGRLEKSINSLRDHVSVLANEEEYLELIKIIRNPGWTTPAEFRLVTTLVETFDRQIQQLDTLKHDLIKAAQIVGAKEREAV